jgi:hypothetical protein
MLLMDRLQAGPLAGLAFVFRAVGVSCCMQVAQLYSFHVDKSPHPGSTDPEEQW